MSVALYIIPEWHIEGFDHFVDGKALGHLSFEHLDALASEAGVPSLTTFLAVPDDLDIDLEAGDDIEWFPPQEGLRSVKGLLSLLSAQPDRVPRQEDIIEDLHAFEQVLSQLVIASAGWYLALDY